MKKKESKPLHLHDLVQGMKVEEIKHIARVIGFSLSGGKSHRMFSKGRVVSRKGKSSPPKDEMVVMLETMLVQDADAVLDGFTVYELQLLCRMLENDGKVRIPYHAEDSFCLCAMQLVGNEFIKDSDEGLELQLTLPIELINAFRPLASTILIEKESDGMCEVEQAAAGILAICGTMPFDTLINELTRLFPNKSEGWLSLNLKRKYLFKGVSPREEGNVVYAATPFLGESARRLFLFRQFAERPEQYKQVEKTKALLMGKQPLPELTTSGAKEMRQLYIDTFGLSEGIHNYHQTWRSAQLSFLGNMMEEILQEVCETEEDITDDVINTIRRFLNHIPRWNLYGHSLVEEARALGVSSDKLEKALENQYFHKGLEIVFDLDRNE